MASGRHFTDRYPLGMTLARSRHEIGIGRARDLADPKSAAPRGFMPTFNVGIKGGLVPAFSGRYPTKGGSLPISTDNIRLLVSGGWLVGCVVIVTGN